MKGLVIKSTGSIFTVMDSEGLEHSVRVKGRLRLDGCRKTSPVAIGDIVDVEGDVITGINERKNYIIRRSSNLSKESQVLAANVDQALLVVTLTKPETAVEFIDRFLVTAYAYRVPVIIAFNKIDIYTDEDKRLLDAYFNLYELNLNYKCLRLSTVTGEGIDELRQMLAGKITLVSGNSGVGKSSIVNSLDDSFRAKTAEISQVHLTGMHTTTYSEMYQYNGGYVIDTPGIKGFGTVDIEASEVGHFFPEIFKEAEKCRFSDCTHTKEPGCAVIKAVEEHRISNSRYCSYLSIMQDATQEKYR